MPLTPTPAGEMSGKTVLVAGAGLAGLAAARDLVALGASVTVVDARDRIGGRVWTIRDGFEASQHAEAGGDLIDEAHHALRTLASELGLTVTRILHRGFAYVRAPAPGRTPRIVNRSAMRGWDALARALAGLSARYSLVEKRWDSPITADIARRSVTEWLDSIGADEELRTSAAGLRGFFLADSEELSLLALVDEFASGDSPGAQRTYRIKGGNGRVAEALGDALGDRVRLKTELVAVSHRGGQIRASLRSGKTVADMHADFLLLALPVTTLRRIPISPSLPTPQHEAIATLKYGRATKTLLQFSTRFWRGPGQPRAFGSPLPIGAVWEGNEEQRGRQGILTLLAGGSASDATREITARDGLDGMARALDWLGAGGSTLVGSRQIGWDHDPWARGGYAFFDPGFDPTRREWLARPFGRIFFAGEHTSHQWQGYMNGAVESGQRAAAEIAASLRLSGTS